MGPTVLQDTTIQAVQPPAGQGPRFRPFASSVHQVTKGRYITSNDPRGYIPVYEYPLNSQWIMMDIDDGYILWTGIWKALGNSKADIVKMIDSQPELAQVIRRVRGGYLKIQGTWMPYEIALRLARRVAWNIREDLIPLFGPTFPSTCLSPDQPGYGQVVASSGRRRARRNPQAPLIPSVPQHESHWQLNGHPISLHQPSPFAPALPLSNHNSPVYSTNPIYPVDAQLKGGQYHGEWPSSQQPRERHRYAPYPAATGMPPPRRLSASSSRGSISLDIPALSLHDRPRATPSPIHGHCADSPAGPIRLPAIQQATQKGAPSVYALPPISALEDLRGMDTHDSAAVLRRLQSDDNSRDELPMRRAISVPPIHSPAQLAQNRRSLGQMPSRAAYGPKLRVSVPSSDRDSNSNSNSTCDPSPISPATPRSAGGGGLALVPLAVLKEQSRKAVAPYSFPVAFSHNDWLGSRHLSPPNGVAVW
ncbi:hypothetical protein C8R46DRAFT_1067619 [Mycena filopes]|nr:hypothetical protein C8R46DRAFT_1067619 [Mycena filopes]